MVGVPRRAGCEACKKRRLKCDLGRPHCSGCKQDGRNCRYPDAFTFVVNEPGSHRTIYRKPLSSSTHLVPIAKHEHKHVCKGTSSPDQRCIAALSCYMIARPKTGNQLPQSISTTNLRNQQFLSHAIHHFSTAGTTQPPTDLNFFQTWITTLRNPSTTCTPLKASALACCAAWFARNDQNPAMIDYSRHLYTQGLQEVRQALRVPDLLLEDETLGACLALTVFEVSECPDRNRVAYDWHRRANLNLLQMRGAKKHREGVGHELFLAARLHGIFHAYDKRVPNFLCSREWLTVPWQRQPKDDFHRLADILARGPHLIREADNLAYHNNKPLKQKLPALLTLLSKLLDIDQDLLDFYADIVEKSARNGEQGEGPFYWEEVDEDEKRQLIFPNARTASLLTLYWSIQTLLYSALSTLHTSLLQTHTLHRLLPTNGNANANDARTTRFLTLAPAAENTWLQSVRRILQSFAYCMRMSVGSVGTPPAGIGVALEIVIDVLRQRRGAEKMLEGSGGDVEVGGSGSGGGCEIELEQALAAREEIGRRWVAIMLA